MTATDPAVFVGSSSEGKEIAEKLQAALEDHCEATVWDQGVFGLSESGLEALVNEAARVDFAILVLTPDDTVIKRGQVGSAVRDNVIFEAGLFAGALGPKRTFLVHARDAKLDLPSDLDGITRCAFKGNRSDGNLRAAVNPSAVAMRDAMAALGLRRPGSGTPINELADASPGRRTLEEERIELDRELDAIAVAAEAQGWLVKTRSDTVFRVLDRGGTRYSLSLGAPRETRISLRSFAQQLSQQGLRMNRTLTLPVDVVPPPTDVLAKAPPPKPRASTKRSPARRRPPA